MTKRELRLPLVVGVLAMATTMPGILIGYLTAPSASVFAGFATDASDDLTFLAAMSQGAHGQWLWRDLYTSTPHPGALLYPLYIVLGHLQRVSGLSPVLLFHATRVVSGVALVVATYWFCSLFFTGLAMRRVAFALAVFGGGVSALLAGLSHLGPFSAVGVDTSIQGAGGYGILFNAPHVSLAATAMLAVFGAAAAGNSMGLRARMVAAALGALVSAVIYPQLLLLEVVVVAVMVLVEGTSSMAAVGAAVLAGAGPFFAYSTYVRATNPVIRAFAEGQGRYPNGDPVGFILLAHTIPALAFIALVVTSRQVPRKAILQLAWIAAAGVLTFLPVGPIVLTRVLFVISVPFGILGAWGLEHITSRIRRPGLSRRVIPYGVMFASLVSPYELGTTIRTAVLHGDARATYLSSDLQAAMLNLEHRPPGAVMNVYLTGIFVPPYSGQRTYLGNQDQTPQLAARQRDALLFYAADGPARVDFMRRRDIRYMVLGPEEKSVAAAAGRGRSELARFRLLVRRGQVEVFELIGP